MLHIAKNIEVIIPSGYVDNFCFCSHRYSGKEECEESEEEENPGEGSVGKNYADK